MTSRTRIALKLACFAGLSLLIHVLILLGISMPAPWHYSEPPPLAVRLQPTPPPPAAAPRGQPRKATPAAAPAPPPVAITEPAPPDASASAAPDSTTAAPGQDAVEKGNPAEIPEVASPREAAPEVPAQVPPVSVPRLPQKGEIDYVLYYGANKIRIGRTKQAWEILDGRYHLSSISETTGFVALFASQRIAYESRGRLTVSGLQPESFTTQRTRSGRTESAGADFDWQSMKVSLGNPRQSAPLPTNTQDLLSFMYQLGLMELMQGRIQMPITNGWKLERYDLKIGPEERLQTPMGPMLAMPVTQARRPGQESVELWLAPAYRLLPVRIRFFDRDGAPSGEQLVDDIRVSAN